jgi:hypothetical protein
MPDVEVVQDVRLGELAARVDELIRHPAEPPQPFRVDETRDRDPAAPLVLLALGLTEDRGVEHGSKAISVVRCVGYGQGDR